jgi:hypothetical protein
MELNGQMLKAGLRLEPALRAILANQQWDPSVKENLTPDNTDWALLKEMGIFFNIFRAPTVQSQADKYPTLHNTIPNYLHIIRQLAVWETKMSLLLSNLLLLQR